jgi:trimeric autotransporter adhesin
MNKILHINLIFVLLTFSTIVVISCKDKKDDSTNPIITLKGSNPYNNDFDSIYKEPGFSATDDVDGDITSNVKVTGTVNIHTEGTYTLKYNVTDKAGNQAEEKTRQVVVLKF